MKIEKYKQEIFKNEIADVTDIYITDDFFEEIDSTFHRVYVTDDIKMCKLRKQFYSIEEYEKNKSEILNEIYLDLCLRFTKDDKPTIDIIEIYQSFSHGTDYAGHAMFLKYIKNSNLK